MLMESSQEWNSNKMVFSGEKKLVLGVSESFLEMKRFEEIESDLAKYEFITNFVLRLLDNEL
jgi:hypothetical protein